jgi:hypothetical protein
MLSDSIYGLRTLKEVLRKEISMAEKGVNYHKMIHINDQLNSLTEGMRLSQAIIRQTVQDLTDDLYTRLYSLNLEQKRSILRDLGNIFIFSNILKIFCYIFRNLHQDIRGRISRLFSIYY